MTTQIVEYSKTEAALADLASRYKNIVFDVATREGMVAAIKGRAELRGYRVALEKTRVELKAPALERTRLIDAEAKRITAELVAMEDPIDEAIKSEETRKERERAERDQRERERIDGIQKAIAQIGATPAVYVGEKSDAIDRALGILRGLEIDASFAEFAVQAAETKGKAIAAMEQLFAGAQAQERERVEAAAKAEAERVELARLRAEQVERERQEAARRAEQEAAARKAREAIESEQRASRAKIEAEERAAREQREREDRDVAFERAAEVRRNAETAKVLREAQDKVDAERRETERIQNELLDGVVMLRKFVERYGKRKEFAAVVKAITAHFAKEEAQQATVRA